MGILGPNGGGKTTILRMLVGILTPTSGTATICGHDVTMNPFAVKARVGFLSGDTALYERLTPREVLRYFGELHGLERATIRSRTEELVDELDMTEFAGRRCGTLSSGKSRKRTWRGRSSTTRPSSCSTSRPRRWTS